MIEFSFKFSLVGVASAFPVLNVKFLDTGLLLFKRLNSDLAAVRKVASVVIHARIRLGVLPAFFLRDNGVFWSSKFLYVQVQHVKLLSLSTCSFFLLLSDNTTLTFQCTLSNFFHFKQLFIHLCEAFRLRKFMVDWIVETFHCFETNVRLLLLFIFNAFHAFVLVLLLETDPLPVRVQLVVLWFIVAELL